MPVHNVCLVGAGNIANTHADALLALEGVTVSAVVDTNLGLARSLAGRFPNASAFANLDEALAARDFERAHVLVPPPLHAEIASRLLQAGVSVLCEKPLATTLEDCRNLIALAQENGVTLGTNQNYIFHPAFQELAESVRSQRYGRLRHVLCTFSMPLRQLAAKKMSHWMFDQPFNLLLEQAVHPLSLIRSLLGEISEVSATAGRPQTISPGVNFYDTCNVTLRGKVADGHLHFAVGRDYPVSQVTALCDDGTITADLIASRTFVNGRSRFPEFIDTFLDGRQMARSVAGSSRRNAINYLLSLFKLKPRTDHFYESMHDSLAAFHAAFDGGAGFESSGEFGADLVRICEEIAGQAFTDPTTARPATPADPGDVHDVVLLGGTGFIGGSTVKQLLSAGKSVLVMARNLNNLDPVFHQDGVTLMRGDITKREDVEKAVSKAPLVVNLAHGGGGSTWEEIERSMVGGARLIGECCLAAGSKRLVHIGSIAGLYLGDSSDTVTGATPPDPSAATRAEYSRGKAESDHALLEMHRRQGLPVCILRPGVVIGEGTSPFHSGLGFYNNDQYCLGWNDGDNPLPFVLVDDTAKAIIASLTAENVDGKCYNLVGDVRLSAQEFIRELATVTGRPLHFYPQSPFKLFLVDVGKWIIKMAIGRNTPFPSLRDIKSRGMVAKFDCSDAKKDLGWETVSDRKEFIGAAIASAGQDS